MKLMDILRVKGTTVYCIYAQRHAGRRRTKARRVTRSARSSCAKISACDLGRVLGIITERDILKACAVEPRLALRANGRPKSMSKDFVTGSPLRLDRRHDGPDDRTPHPPLAGDGRRRTEGDDLDRRRREGPPPLGGVENHYLKSYIQS